MEFNSCFPFYSYCSLYYAEIGIGTPSKNYYVQVDTGSDILWVNCVTCTGCPRKSDIGVCLGIRSFYWISLSFFCCFVPSNALIGNGIF